MSDELTFEDVLKEIENNPTTLEIGGYRFKELTLEEHKRLLNTMNLPIVAPIKISNLYNDFIGSKVEFTEELVPVISNTTIDKKVPLLIALRAVSFGDTVKDDDGKEYKLYTPTVFDFSIIYAPETLKVGEITINLAVPTIEEDSFYNNKLIERLTPSGKKRNNPSEEDIMKTMEDYQMYEIMKYIKEVHHKDTHYTFINVADSHKEKLLNILPQKTISQIADYINKTKEKESHALTVTAEDGTTKTIDAVSIFYSEPKLMD